MCGGSLALDEGPDSFADDQKLDQALGDGLLDVLAAGQTQWLPVGAFGELDGLIQGATCL